ncbi:hydroxyectoine utilization dehydratase EutB [Rhizobium sp. AB2/73]|uniref:hydroxyectoine utilization dehydratase EutB n=2 Tax=Rhizobium sp. AB2/73 TaxID=2795216 RepID=UPI001C5E7298|nr:hydroxyectoine utilization dehydratase EutB [Rhizobium sp. AB2/73]QYA16558.1 hydroxyectoine utilization dehydratase EutB [Rhizobium sp. AB2/73]UEQ85101.1 hydroxyectoine utilization dehydratase EutB [Rhizobium sp. AB2/73]
MTMMVTLEDIEAARRRIAPKVLRTPLRLSQALSQRTGIPVHLKLENHQHTGSFKLRGATNALLCLDEKERSRGLVTASTGNHGRAVAHAAKAMGARATICLSALVPTNKVEAIRNLGADIRIVGYSQDDAMSEVERLVREEGMYFIPPFDDADVIAGQGTLGLEVADDLPETALVLVPLSGGGLASGVAAAIRSRLPTAKVVGVSMERGAAMAASLAAGRPTDVQEVETLADSLGGGIGLDNRLTFRMCRTLLDDVILLSEEEIAAGIRHAALIEELTVEGAGAVGIAALLAGKIKSDGPTVVVVSGGNIDPAVHRAIVDGIKAEVAP